MVRRSFLAKIVQLLSAILAAFFALPVFTFIRGLISDRFDEFYPVTPVSNLEKGVTQVFYTRVVRDGWMERTIENYVWIRKKTEDDIVVFEPHCTHLGCAYVWDEHNQRFECPCHLGKFDQDGNRIAGPPPRPLDRYEIKIKDGQIQIGKIIKA